MTVKTAVGKESFDVIRRQQGYYVDKTELLYELVQTNNSVSLFTRPRRFGKTLNMSMIESFFDIRRSSADVFAGLKITEHQAFCKEWMNQHPVLFLTFKGVEALEFDGAYAKLKATIANLCKKHAYLEGEKKTDPADQELFRKLKFETADPAAVKNSLQTIMRMMSAVYEKPVILLIDEYDVPLARASERNTSGNRYYEKMLDVIQGMFEAALKTNEYLNFAVVTGCLRIAKESIFTGTNNFKSYSVLDAPFSGYFGFTQKETEELLDACGLTDKAEQVRKWYDGYRIGNTPLYCPWDVVNFASDVMKENTRPQNYWKNTSHNGVLLTFVKRTDFDVSDKFETLLNGGTIRQTISDELTYDTLHETEENLWSVLVMTGYLTKTGTEETGNTVDLKIPNEEIFNIFEDTVVTFFKDTLDRTKQKELMEALWNGDAETASILMTRILFGTISYHDYHENYYHAFLTGLISGFGYAVKSNLENGLGRSDIDIRDKKNLRGMLIETKKSETEALMEKDALDGLKQIVDNRYLLGFEGFEQVTAYGISFYKKKALVKKLPVKL